MGLGIEADGAALHAHLQAAGRLEALPIVQAGVGPTQAAFSALTGAAALEQGLTGLAAVQALRQQGASRQDLAEQAG